MLGIFVSGSGLGSTRALAISLPTIQSVVTASRPPGHGMLPTQGEGGGATPPRPMRQPPALEQRAVRKAASRQEGWNKGRGPQASLRGFFRCSGACQTANAAGHGAGQGARTAAPIEQAVGSGARGRSGCPPPPVGRRSPEMGVGIVRRPTGLQEHVRIPL